MIITKSLVSGHIFKDNEGIQYAYQYNTAIM